MFRIHRTLEESPEFKEHCEAIEETRQHIDDALNALTWALCNDAEQYPIIPGTSGLRLARSEEYQREGVFVPALKVWFSIVGPDRVLLRMITYDEPDSDDEIF